MSFHPRTIPTTPTWGDRTIPTTNFTGRGYLGGAYLLDWNGVQILDWNSEPIITIVPGGNIPLNSWSTRPVI